MNRIYRLVWNEAQGAWVAVTEIARGHGPRALRSARRLRRMGLAAFAAGTAAAAFAAPPVGTPPAANTVPTGGQVVAGQAGISQNGAVVTVQQGSARAAIDWQRFDLGRDATINFSQPGRDSVTLNRVLDGNPSQIFGRITATGQVFLSNPSGVYFAPSASADVGGLVATTMSMGVDDFMAGSTTFHRNGSTAGVTNEGSLQARYGGYIALLAPEVVNSGVVVAQAGTVALAAGEAVELQFDAGSLAKLRVEPAAVKALIDNRQAVQAPDGVILMSARAAQTLQGGVIRHSGAMAADSLRAEGGRIVLEADHIQLAAGSTISATGATGGGDVRIGGGWQGSGDTYQSTTVDMAAGASVDASATGRGNGGSVVLWSDIRRDDSVTTVQGRIAARGGAQGGDGGRVETSGHALGISGSTVDASAAAGAGGQWLVDPYDMTISSSPAVNNTGWASIGPNSNMWVGDLVGALNSGTSITVATGTGGSDRGDITVNAAITKSSGSEATLTFRAANSIIVNQAVGASGSARLNIVFDADNNGGVRDGAGMTLLNANIASNGGSVSFGTGATMTLNGASTLVGGDVYFGSGASTITTAGGALNVRGQALIGNSAGLTVNTGGGNVNFMGAIDAANSYSYVSSGPITWADAFTAAKGATAGGSATGDTYLATLTSRVENMVASQAANYASAWLGARRGVTTANATSPTPANDTWRWVAGPEGQADGGQGQPFFQGRTPAGTAVAGRFTNWSSGEPNDYAPGESALQFTGNAGRWNDQPVGLTAGVQGYLRETNAAPVPLTINAGTGTVTFGGAVGAQKALSALTVTGSTIAINGGGVRTEGAQTYTGPITLGSAATVLETTGATTDLVFGNNQTISYAGGGAAELTLLSARHINLGTNSRIESTGGALDVTFNADSDRANAAGRTAPNAGGGVFANAGLYVRTNGGDLRIGGGDARDGSGHAMGVTGMNENTRGIFLRAVDIDVGTGSIEMRGTGSTTEGEGILVQPSGVQNWMRAHGSGHILLDGIGGAAGTPASWTTGIALERMVLQSDAGDITLTGVGGGYGSSTPVNQSGVRFAVGGNSGVVSGSGHIRITGTMGSPTGFGSNGAGIEFAVATALGNGTGSSGAVTGSTSDITLSTDNLAIASGTSLSSTGVLTVAPLSASASIGVGGAAGTLQLASNFFTSTAADGFGSIRIGRADGTGLLSVASLTARDALALVNGSGGIALQGQVNAGTNSVTLQGNGAITELANAGITTTGLRLLGAATVDLQGSGNAIGTVAGSVGSLALAQAGGLTIGTVGGSSGLTGTGALSVATANGDIQLDGPLATSAGGSNAIVLNAGRNAAAGTAGGGNIVAGSGASVTMGAGGQAVLYTGAINGSTGVAALAGPGSFRYGSDETTSAYSRALGTGVNVVYREQPTVTLQVADATSIYGQPAAFGFTGSGYANGDADAMALSGTAAYAVAGAQSSSGRAAVGAHTVSLSGLTSDLGYQLQTTDGTLTVTPATVSVSGIAAGGKVYDRTTVASLATTNAQFQGLVGSDVLTVASATGHFADRNVGTGKTVAITGMALGGADAANYVLASTTSSATADITPASISAVTGITAAGKVYDGTTAATLDTTNAQFQGLIGGDALTVAAATGNFANKNAGRGKAVAVSGLALGGADAGNYTLASTTSSATADITPATITAITGITAADRTYDGTTATTLDSAAAQFAGKVAGDTLTVATANGSFADKQAGAGKAVQIGGLTLGGADAGNYTLATASAATTASIAQATLALAGRITAVDKIEDGTVAAQVDLSGLILAGAVAGDSVTLGRGNASFDTAQAGNGRTVTVTGFTLTGTDAANYRLASDRVTTTADIYAPPPLTVPTPAPTVEPPGPVQAPPGLPTDAGTTLSSVPIRISGAPAMTALPAAPVATRAIAVDLVQSPASTAGGLVSVTVPREMAQSPGGFVFPLPTELQRPIEQGASVTVTTAEGRALPAWLRFDASSRSFVSGAVPTGGLPLQVVLTINGQRTLMSISAQ